MKSFLEKRCLIQSFPTNYQYLTDDDDDCYYDKVSDTGYAVLKVKNSEGHPFQNIYIPRTMEKNKFNMLNWSFEKKGL